MATADDWYRELGRFVSEFEHCCNAARMFIVFFASTASEDPEARTSTIVQHLEAMQLADTVHALLMRAEKYGPEEKALVEGFRHLIKQRNLIVHSPWFIGWASPGKPFDAPFVLAASLNRKAEGASLGFPEPGFR
jgi:hypothetical protein